MFDLYEVTTKTAKPLLVYSNNNNTGNQFHLLPTNNREYYKTHGLFESSLIKWCGDVFGDHDATKIMIDIGAHTGTYAISLATRFKSVVCFEPQKAPYYALCGSVAMSGLCDRIECHRIGLGAPEQCGDDNAQTLYIPSIDGGGASIFSPDAPQPQQGRQEKITIRALDEYGFTNVGFIKMDIEGNELNCLRGAIKTIKASRPKIIFEANTAKDLEAVTEFLTSSVLHYRVVAINGYPNMFIGEAADEEAADEEAA